MKITFLGTGTSQGVPVIACRCRVCTSTDRHDKRLRSSILIESDGHRLVVDCGPDFRYQMLRENVGSIDGILITHGHKDHTGGLDDVRAFNYINKRPAEVYSTSSIQRIIRNEFSYAFDENKYPGAPEIILHTFINKPFTAGGLDVIPIRARHFNKQFVYGFRIGKFTYITDAKEISEREKRKIRGSEVVVVNALRKEKHYSHFCLDEALALLDEIRPKQGFLTHISHQMGLYKEVKNELPSNVRLAYDGLKVEIS
jgi:phosphoribosyl 1,2-cyclic phosphate phosphodiesterase